MKAIEFPQQNKILLKPDDMTDEECFSLPIFSDGKNCISLWELNEQEIQELVRTKRIWLWMVSGHTQPPVLLQVESPFEGESACRVCGKPVKPDGHLVVADIEGVTVVTQAYCAEHWEQLGK